MWITCGGVRRCGVEYVLQQTVTVEGDGEDEVGVPVELGDHVLPAAASRLGIPQYDRVVQRARSQVLACAGTHHAQTLATVAGRRRSSQKDTLQEGGGGGGRVDGPSGEKATE